MNKLIQITVNGKPVRLTTEEDRPLLSVIRTDLGLTGVKYGCGKGVCGACTVLINNSPVRACQATIGKAKGKRILTIEGLARAGRLHPLQNAFIQNGAFQCGYCTSGMILQAYSLILQNRNPSVRDITESMEGNLCRCGTYPRVIKAIQEAAMMMKGGVK